MDGIAIAMEVRRRRGHEWATPSMKALMVALFGTSLVATSISPRSGALNCLQMPTDLGLNVDLMAAFETDTKLAGHVVFNLVSSNLKVSAPPADWKVMSIARVWVCV